MLEKLATHYGGQAVFELSTRITGMNHHALIYLSLVWGVGGVGRCLHSISVFMHVNRG